MNIIFENYPFSLVNKKEVIILCAIIAFKQIYKYYSIFTLKSDAFKTKKLFKNWINLFTIKSIK